MTGRPLSIALVSAFPPGRQSLNEYGYHLAKGLADRDDVERVVVIADRLPDDQPELELSPKISVRRVWDFNRLSTPLRLIRALADARVDGTIWNLQVASFGDRELPAGLGLMSPMLARWSGAPGGIIAHNLVSGIDLEATVLRGQRLRQAVVRAGAAVITRAMLRANYMTVTLGSYADLLSARYPRADVTLVPHGTFDTDPRPAIPLADRPERIVTMGKFGTYKRLETLLAAFDILRQDSRFSGYELVVGGSDHPSTPGYVDGLRRARASDGGVRFGGYVAEEDVPALFEGGRISVFDYSATTGSSGVLHQAASFGTVPIFPRIGDFVDLCEDEGLRGHHYAPGDAAQMAEAMAAALSDLGAAQAMANGNRAASMGMPFSEVVAFHVDRIAGFAHSARVAGGAQPAAGSS